MSTVDKKKPVEETYVDRMRKELEDLKARTTALSKFFYTDRFKELPKRKQDLLYSQFEGMQVYQIALSERVFLEVTDA